MIRNGQFSVRSIQSRIGRWTFESALEPVTPSIKAGGEETRQTINRQIVCESHRHSLFSGRSTDSDSSSRSSEVKTLSPKHTAGPRSRSSGAALSGSLLAACLGLRLGSRGDHEETTRRSRGDHRRSREDHEKITVARGDHEWGTGRSRVFPLGRGRACSFPSHFSSFGRAGP
jgi:hypothetical protein